MNLNSDKSYSTDATQKTNPNDPISKDKYVLKNILRKGEFAISHLCTDKKGKEKIIKFLDKESYYAEMELTKKHIKTIKSLFDFDPDIKSFNRFNNVLDYGYIEGIKLPFIVYEKLGKDLNDVRKEYNGRQIETFNGMRILMDCLSIINYLHNIGYIHRSLKPSSFCCRQGSDTKNLSIVLTNFETCCKIVDSNDIKNLPDRMTKFGGRNLKYCSINQHNKEKIYQINDDLESWYYIGLLLFEGALPWSFLRIEQDKEIIKAKESLKDLSSKFFSKTPDVFRDFLKSTIIPLPNNYYSQLFNSMLQIVNKFSECIITDNSSKELNENEEIEKNESDLVPKNEHKKHQKPSSCCDLDSV